MSKLKTASVEFFCDDDSGFLEIKYLSSRPGFLITKTGDGNTKRLELTLAEAEVLAKTILEMCGEGEKCQ